MDVHLIILKRGNFDKDETTDGKKLFTENGWSLIILIGGISRKTKQPTGKSCSLRRDVHLIMLIRGDFENDEATDGKKLFTEDRCSIELN